MHRTKPPEIGSEMSDPNMLAQSSKNSHSNGTTIGNSNSSDSADEDQISIRFADWGFKIDRLFEVAYRFYKRNESKAFHPSFDERNKMIALVMQARYGNHDSGRASDVGVLDFVGQRRQYEWSMLSGMSKTEAMSKFICALDYLCPLFKAHAEAVKISSGIVEGDTMAKSSFREEVKDNKPAKVELDPQMHNIYSSLCKQTYNQFKGYAEKQYPDDLTKQKYLVTSLQEQYYQQYISQMHPELKSSLPDSSQTSNQSNSNIPSSLPSPAISDRSYSNNESIVNNQTDDSSMIEENRLPFVLTAAHLELPLPVREVQMPVYSSEVKTYANTDDDEKPGSKKINESIYRSDIYCEENNVQADISSEELNSDPSANEATSVAADTVDRFTESNITEKMKSICLTAEKQIYGNKLRNENMKESVRLFRNSDPPPIGVFESFPEPRPIKTSSQKSTPIDQIDPNMPRAFLDASGERETARESISDPQTPSNPKELTISQQVISPTSALQGDPDQTVPNQLFTEANYYDEPHQAALSAADSRTQEPSAEESIVMASEQRAAATPDTTATNIEESPKAIQVSQAEGPELWGYSSDSGHSPILPEMAPYQEPEPATIWSRREIAQFKESLDNDKQAGIYEVKESTLIIFEVPTYPDGKYIYWEFATDDFDIGFGLEFVYEQQLAQPLALKIYEDADDDDMDDMLEEAWSSPQSPSALQLDPESGRVSRQKSTSDLLEVRQKILAERRRRQGNTISIVPTYRRDSHQEVFVGRHKYPGRGYYLLRFDNTYSVLRSKTLYFRICYFM